MKLRKAKNYPIYHLLAPDRHTVCYTMMRIVESDGGGSFDLDEYIEWYALKAPFAKGYFGYDREWSGCAIDKKMLVGFRNNFKDFTGREKKLYRLLRMSGAWRRKDFVLLLTFDGDKFNSLRHEIYHALYYLIPEYKELVGVLVEKSPNLNSFKRTLIRHTYPEDNLDDELQAYALDEFKTTSFRLPVTKAMQKFREDLLAASDGLLPNIKTMFGPYKWKV
jgi:hypothetical protein